MRGLRQRPLYWLKSVNRQGAVIDIDILVAYLLFITTVLLMINYTLSLTAPFSTSIESVEKEKNTVVLKGLVKNEFALSNLSSLCDEIDYVNLRLFSMTYEIKGFHMPFIDNSNVSPGSLNASVVFNRSNTELQVITGSTESAVISIEVNAPNGASVTNVSLESNDSFSIINDDFGNSVVSVSSNVNSGDTDKIIIKPLSGVVSFRLTGANLSNSYVGDTLISDYCGTQGIRGPRTSFNRYGIMTDGRSDYYVTLTGDVWWTS